MRTVIVVSLIVAVVPLTMPLLGSAESIQCPSFDMMTFHMTVDSPQASSGGWTFYSPKTGGPDCRS